MAISQQYGMGTYNFRLPSINTSIPKIAGGVATPLAFFPSTRSGDVTESLDSFLQDLIDSASGGSSYSSENTSSDRGGYSTGRTGGLGLGETAASGAKAATSLALGYAGAPPAVANVTSSLVGGIANKGISDEDVANLAISTALTTLGVPGLALGALSALGFNPAQGISEALGIANVTPGFEGGFFGSQGIGFGISGPTIALGISTENSGMSDGSTPAGYSGGDLGSGLSYGGQTDTPAGFEAGDLGTGLQGGGISTGLTGGDISSDSSSSSSDKIVCTAMNATYGFGSYRNTIWLQYSKKHLSPHHQIGYHTIFLPLVHRAYYTKNPNLKLRAVLEHLMRHRTADLRAIMQGRRRDILGCIYRNIFEPICYIVGFIKSKLTPLADK